MHHNPHPDPLPNREREKAELEKQPLIAHLVDLRKRFVISFLAFVIATIICYEFAADIYAFLVQPLANALPEGEHRRLIFTGLTEAFFTYLKLAVFAGFFVSFPIIASQIYLFLAPGLYKKERKTLIPYLVAAPALFIIGAAFVYYFIFPAAWRFFLGFESAGGQGGLPIQLEARVAEYLSLSMHLIIAFGLSFQLPVVLVLLVRSRGLGWTELGLGREHWRTGAGYALAAFGVVGAVIAIGALLPWTRPMFLNNHYATVSGALIASMVIIPLQTVIPEELAFRGVLHGALDRAWGFRGVAAAGSLLFGLWHIATSLGLTAGNVGFTRILGGGPFGMIAGVVGAVIATAAAGFVFTWLRRRSGSLIAPIALHWSLNGMGALAAAVVWHLST